jgi:hypothetical protein
MTIPRRIHSTLLICVVGFQHRTYREEKHQQNLGMYRFFAN